MEHYGTHGMLYNQLLGDVTGVFTDLTASSTFRYNSVLTDDTAVEMAISEQSFLLNVSEFDEGVLDVTDTFWGYNVTQMLEDSGITEPLDDLVDHPLIYDYREDGLMARSNYGPWAPNAYPLPKCSDQQWSRCSALTGFEMTASAVDPEDGALSGAAFFWVVDGDADSGLSGEAVLVSGLAVGMHTFNYGPPTVRAKRQKPNTMWKWWTSPVILFGPTTPTVGMPANWFLIHNRFQGRGAPHRKPPHNLIFGAAP